MIRRLTFLFVLVLVCSAVLAQEPAPAPFPERLDAQEILKRSLGHWRRNLDAARNYTFQEREAESELNKDGSVNKTEIKTYDVSIIYGDPYEKLIAKDDQPLSEKDRQKEEEKFNKYFDKQKNKSDADREKERAKERDKFQREIADELPRMLNYRIVGDEIYQGQPVWVLGATPRSEYKSNSMAAKLLSKLSGKAWITKDDYQWVKVEADLAEDFSVGWFLFKLHKGTHLEFEQTRVNDEVWLPKRIFVEGSGRIAVKTARFRNTTDYSKYEKFRTDVKITGVAEEVPAASDTARPNK